ncbi:uncharacterized protein LOC100843698 isoform X1 [Brachypodium distachyon]|nr:uncharacterized protein LOC100843698 isoform X1 [Brachypodium distachyon]|eukprot:XP_014751891.1 uncharacterized protein LOC100843698 isoform X1 [Brachypodium distachyon]
MPPKELPGFYYDAEKNRYFPITGPIPGAAKRRRPPSPPPPPLADPPLTRRRKRVTQSELLRAREMYGGGVMFSSGNSKCTFRQQCQHAQASQPLGWSYQGTSSMADKAVEELRTVVQTPSGLRESKVLVTGSINGTVRLFGLGTALQNFEDEVEYLSELAWTPLRKLKVAMKSGLANIWSPETAFSNFSSSITCIKKFGHKFRDAATTYSSVGRALVATLGSRGSGGSLYMIDLSLTTDLAMVSLNAYGKIERLGSYNRTVWTADCSSDGTQVALGANNGAALLNLEKRSLSWMYHCKSDVLSQQFMHSGNVVLCGLRNGSIVAIDVRQRHRNFPTGLASPGTARRTVPMLPATHQADKAKSTRAISMSSAVCSLVALSSDENYFLGSSMDGSIKLFDLRLIQKGAVQSYVGHVNSHTHLPLAVDPSETLLMSGGEDSTVRIWSIKTGEQVFEKRVADTLFTALCWPESGLDVDRSSLFDLRHSWGAWMGSRDGLYYMHGT